ncbi:MAG: nucleotidyltransferase family protein [Phycisphaerales bacterium]
MPPSDQSHILVLAAGRGTRMGEPKATMRVGDRPWCQVQCERLEKIGIAATWVVSDESLAALKSVPGAACKVARTVRADSSKPMFESVIAGVASVRPGLGAAPIGGLFVLPVDVPAARDSVWQTLRLSRHVAVPAFRGATGHPVFLPWPWVDRHLEVSDSNSGAAPLRLDHLMASDRITIEVNDPDVAINLNTTEDVAAWLGSRSAGDTR